MKKALIVAALCAAFVGSAAGVYAAGFRCSFCGGSGFQGNRNCIHCQGTGRNNSY